MPKGKRISANLKAQIVLEALREDKSVAQSASENHIHPNQIDKWKKQALENFAQLLKRTGKASEPEKRNMSGSSMNCTRRLGA